MQRLVSHYSPIYPKRSPAPEKRRFDAAMQLRPVRHYCASHLTVHDHRPELPASGIGNEIVYRVAGRELPFAGIPRSHYNVR
jgi:hypothetical protein